MNNVENNYIVFLCTKCVQLKLMKGVVLKCCCPVCGQQSGQECDTQSDTQFTIAKYIVEKIVARKNRTTELERKMIYEENKIRKKEFI